jgi:dienelactone hydrolase
MHISFRRAAVAGAALGLVVTAGAAVPASAGTTTGTAGTTTATAPADKGLDRAVRAFSVTLPSGDPADVYVPRVPARAAGLLEDAFPVVAVLQGANVDKSQYSRVSRLLAARGFVVVVPNKLRAVAPPPVPPGLFTTQDVVDTVLAGVTTLDADPASPLYKIAATRSLGVLGHSFGGAAALFAAAGVCQPPFCFGAYVRPPQLKAVAVYGTNLATGTQLDQDLDTTGVAVQLIQGTRDGIAPPVEAEVTFRSLERPRAYSPVRGANHYGITDQDDPPGAVPDPNSPTISQETANRRVAALAALWFSRFLRNGP